MPLETHVDITPAGQRPDEDPSLAVRNNGGVPPSDAPAPSGRREALLVLGFGGPEGVRSNIVAAGPLRSMAMKSIPGSKQFEEAWEGRAPLGWSVTDTEPAGKAVAALLSDWFPATTGEIVHVDGGYHAIGA